MNGDVIEKITDYNFFEDYFNKFFRGRTVYLKTGDVNISVEYLQYKSDNEIEIKIDQKIDEKNVIIFTRQDDLIIFSPVSYISKHENNIYVFKPAQIQVVRVPRKEERKTVDQADAPTKEKLFISSIVSDIVISHSIEKEKKKIEFIRSMIIEKLSEYTFANVYFPGDKPMDARLKYFYKERQPIYIPDMKSEKFIYEQKSLFEIYKKTMFGSDRSINWDRVTSEISAPFMYRLMLPVGYIQLNNHSGLSAEQFSSIRKLGFTFSELLTQNDVIKPADETIYVKDVSKSGLSVFFTQRNLIKYFKNDGYQFFHINLPGNKVVPVYTVTRNITIIENKIYRIGCEILDMDAIGETHYDEYVNT